MCLNSFSRPFDLSLSTELRCSHSMTYVRPNVFSGAMFLRRAEKRPQRLCPFRPQALICAREAGRPGRRTALRQGRPRAFKVSSPRPWRRANGPQVPRTPPGCRCCLHETVIRRFRRAPAGWGASKGGQFRGNGERTQCRPEGLPVAAGIGGMLAHAQGWNDDRRRRLRVR